MKHPERQVAARRAGQVLESACPAPLSIQPPRSRMFNCASCLKRGTIAERDAGRRREGASTMKFDKGFAPFHRWDRNFFLLMVALIWLGILMGFVPEIVDHIRTHKPFPLIVHIHGAVFLAWLVLLTTQLALVRFGRPDLHKTLGILGAMLAGGMIVLGSITAVVADYLHFGTKDSDPPFLAIQWGDILIFGPLAAAALLLRERPPAHKRLILLATIFISDAGFARWLGDDFKFAGDGFWGQYLQLYVFDFLLVALFAAYDYVTRRKLHPAFLAGAAWGLSIELLAIWLYVSPWWKPVATTLIGR
jgi:hypothetical protein